MVSETIVARQSKEFSVEKITPPATSNKSFSPKLKWYNSIIRVEFKLNLEL